MWESLRPRYKDFMWDSLNEQIQNNIKDAIKNVEWPILYPEWLKNMFKEIKK
jgi:GH35 family endo-1,4-beta-xylanase